MLILFHKFILINYNYFYTIYASIFIKSILYFTLFIIKMTNLENNEENNNNCILSSITDDKWRKKLIDDNKIYKKSINDIPPKYLYNLNHNKSENINIPVTCFEDKENTKNTE